ncbi:hypothetical protein BKA93DRAFT_758508 [Sparassis latifolia]|uniref:Vacuole protein n=1 Tax=Sparassis crispa TaxID=139825 RepID=A0A401GC54_9APHY|nr:hypothetical protein SCP_0209430 [Sparassis crispa]GBE79742.1 hypothetical protein SCP_0209430 [Sparassis crispa]
MCGGSTWKREVVPDHKFDFVDTREFTDHGIGMRFKYLFLYISVFISFLVYVSDIFTAVTMLTTKSWSNEIYNSCPPDQSDGCVYIPFSIGKWLFFGCIIFSFLLLAYEARKAKKIIASRDISYAFTNVMAHNYYSLRSYDHFCFFDHISNSTKKQDDFAFFVFFTFKGWKRIILAEGPRQSINALTLYAFYLTRVHDGSWYDISKYFAGNDILATALTISTGFTVLVFALSLLMLIIAGICYIPLLCYIQGNLKEYCCHKVDKRIAEIIKRRNKQRLAKAAALAKKEAAGDYSHLKNKKGELVVKPLPQPTLPNVSLDDDDDASSMRTRGPPPSTVSPSDYYYAGQKGPSEYVEYAADNDPMDYPPMPGYNQPYAHHPDMYHQYNPSTGTFQDDQAIYDDEYASTAHLTSSAAPFGKTDDGAHMMHNPYSTYTTNQHDPHQGNGTPVPEYTQYQAYPQHPQGHVPAGGAAYETHGGALYNDAYHHETYEYDAGQAHAV